MSKNLLIKELDQILYEISKLVGNERNNILKDGISWSQIWLLKFLAEKDKVKVSEIAEKMGVSPPAITSLTDKLIKQELVERIRCNKDRRVVYLQSTDKGIQFIEEIRLYRKNLLEKYLENISIEELNLFINTYRKIKNNVERYNN